MARGYWRVQRYDICGWIGGGCCGRELAATEAKAHCIAHEMYKRGATRVTISEDGMPEVVYPNPSNQQDKAVSP